MKGPMIRALFAAAAMVAASVLLMPRTHVRAAQCSPVYYRAAGSWMPARLHEGPGLVLSGGGLSQMPDVTVLQWMRERAAAPKNVRASNLLILKASEGRDYTDDFYKWAPFASVREVFIPPCAARSAVDAVAPAVDRADFVLFSGGDQAHYAAWKGSPLVAAVRHVYARGGIVGGGSAGLAIQAWVVFDSVAADRVLPDDEDVQTADAVRDPYERAISFTTQYFHWPPLRNAITDTHFARRNRFGRSAAFMARALHDGLVSGNTIYDVAVDEGSALLVDSRGVATLVQRNKKDDGYVPQGAWILTGTPAPLPRGRPLRYTVHVVHLQFTGQRYDLMNHRGAGETYTVTVDGSKTPMYSRNPYGTRRTARP